MRTRCTALYDQRVQPEGSTSATVAQATAKGSAVATATKSTPAAQAANYLPLLACSGGSSSDAGALGSMGSSHNPLPISLEVINYAETVKTPPNPYPVTASVSSRHDASRQTNPGIPPGAKSQDPNLVSNSVPIVL